MATTPANTAALIYDWNEKERTGPLLRRAPRFVDETIMPNVNFERMTALAVGRSWRQASATDRVRSR